MFCRQKNLGQLQAGMTIWNVLATKHIRLLDRQNFPDIYFSLYWTYSNDATLTVQNGSPIKCYQIINRMSRLCFLSVKDISLISGCVGIPVPMPVHPRIILVTDGHCTGTNIIAGPDKLCDAEEQAQVKHAGIRMGCEGIFPALI